MPILHRDNERVTPIYAVHETDFEVGWAKEREFLGSIRNNRLPGQVSMWPEKGIDGVRRLQPRVLAIDSLAASERYWSGIYTYLPENPFNMRWNTRDVFIVAGDTPNNTTSQQDKDMNQAIWDEFHTVSQTRTREHSDHLLTARNSILTLKAIETARRLPENDWEDNDRIGLLLGNGHELTVYNDYSSDPIHQKKGLVPAILSTVARAFSNYVEREVLDRKETFYNFPQDKLAVMEQDLIRFLGLTKVWRVKDGDINDPSTYEKYIEVTDEFIEPTIEALVREVTRVNFLPDMRARLDYLQQWALMPRLGSL